MKTEQTEKQAVARPATKADARAEARKIERALEIRKSSARAREGKPLAFPANRLRLRP